jgi:hypothetical protein
MTGVVQLHNKMTMQLHGFVTDSLTDAFRIHDVLQLHDDNWT